LALTVGACAFALYSLGLRPDFSTQATTLHYWGELAMLSLATLLAGSATLLLRKPDLRFEKPALSLGFSGLAIMLGFVLYAAFHAPMHTVGHDLLSLHGHHCSVRMAVISLVPSLFILYRLKRAAPMRPALAGSFAVLAVACLAAACARLFCPVDAPSHLLLWTFGPTLLFSGIGYLIGRICLKW
jgi:hypothetical protein